MSKVTEMEVRFNAKSSAQTISEALALAEKHGADTGGKTCAVQFANPADPDIQKLLNLVSGLKGSKVVVNGQEHRPKDVLSTLICVDRPVCKGAIQSELGYDYLIEDFEVNEAGNVTSIDFSHICLETIPPSLLKLPYLIELNFSDNSFSSDEEVKQLRFDGKIITIAGAKYIPGQIAKRISVEMEEMGDKENVEPTKRKKSTPIEEEVPTKRPQKARPLYAEDSVRDAPGITEAIGKLLEEVGVMTVEDLMSANPTDLAQEIGDELITSKKIKLWQQAARQRMKAVLKEDEDIEEESEADIDTHDYDIMDI